MLSFKLVPLGRQAYVEMSLLPFLLPVLVGISQIAEDAEDIGSLKRLVNLTDRLQSVGG